MPCVPLLIRLSGGVEVEVSHPSELEETIAVLRAAGLLPPEEEGAASGDAKHLWRQFGAPTPRTSSTVGQLLQFMRFLRQANGYVESAAAAEACGLSSPRALGGAMVTWSKILSAISMEIGDVAVPRRRNKISGWEPGRRLPDAIRALEAPDIEAGT